MTLLGCQAQAAITPEEILHDLVSAETKQDYYAKVRYTETIDDETTNIIVEEKREGNRTYIESTDLETGQKSYVSHIDSLTTFYDEISEFAFQIPLEADLPIQDVQTQLDMLQQLLNSLQTDEVFFTKMGEETLINRTTDQLQAKNLSSQNLFEEITVWIDQESKFILKYEGKTSDSTITSSYEELDFNVQFQDQDFILSIPEHIELKDMEELLPQRSISLEEAQHLLGTDFLILDKEGISIADIEVFDSVYHNEISFIYTRDDIEYVTLTIFEVPDDSSLEGSFFHEETIEFRHTVAAHFSSEQFQSITWDENDLRYSLVSMNPYVSTDDLIKLENDFILNNLQKE